MSHVQTYPGLKLMRDNYLAAIECAPWSNKKLIQDNLELESDLLFPVFAIRYNRVSSGILLYSKVSYCNFRIPDGTNGTIGR